MTQILEVRTTLASEKDALTIARTLVTEHLAACVQLVPGLKSVYFWEETAHEDSEVLLLIKTTEGSWPALRDRLAELHPYDTPEILAVPVAHGTYNYINWVQENVKAG